MRYSPREVRIAEATEKDSADILAVQKAAFYRQGLLYDDMALPPLIQTEEELALDFGVYTFLKALYHDRIVGSVRGRVEGGACLVSRLVVHPEHQNRGIGKMLMAALEHRFSDARRFELFTGHKSEKSLAFYGKLGYREIGRVPVSEKVTHVKMEKARNPIHRNIR